jgi:hypothetical protein
MTTAHKKWQYRRHLNGGHPLLVPAEASAAHAGSLQEQGIALKAIAVKAGVNYDNLCRIASGEARWVRQETHRRIMSVRTAEGFYVDATGTHRRLQALVWLGWPLREFDRVRGVAPCATARILRKTVITRPTRDEIASLYDRYWSKHPDPQEHFEKMTVTQARRRAVRLGYAPPAAWDDIDDPAERPKV